MTTDYFSVAYGTLDLFTELTDYAEIFIKKYEIKSMSQCTMYSTQ